MKNVITVNDAARVCGVTPARIRQLCSEHKPKALGEKISRNCRLLSPADLRTLKSLLSEMQGGRPRKKSEVTA